MPNKNGNVLFLILIAVALFAALSYAITSSSRGSGTIDRENAAITASEISEYINNLRFGIKRLKIVNGCEDRELNFNNPIETGYNNTSAPTDGSCDVFGAKGANLTFSRPSAGTGADEPYYITGIRYLKVGDDSLADIIIYLPLKNKAVCDAINNRHDLPTTNVAIDRITRTTYYDNVKFKGSFGSNHNRIPNDGGDTAAFEGKYEACLVSDTSDNTYYPGNLGIEYFYVAILVAR